MDNRLRIWKPNLRAVNTAGMYILSDKMFRGWLSALDYSTSSFYWDVIVPAIYRGMASAYILPRGAYWDDAGTLSRYLFNNLRLSGGRTVVAAGSVVESSANLELCVVLNGVVVSELSASRSVISRVGGKLIVSKVP
jgi:ADP-glucose pyrophosphorylase